MSNKNRYLVIGGGGLLGSNLICEILLSGATVLAIDKDLENMKKALSLLDVALDSSQLHLKAVDITNEPETIKFFNEIGHLDGAVNCSYPRGKNYGASFFNVSQEEFNNNVSLHLGSAFLIMRECASYFHRNKHPFSLVNIASIYGSCAPDFSIYDGTEMTTPVEYAAIKSAIIHMNKYVASYVSNSEFRVNSISPGGLMSNQPSEFINAYKKKTLGHGMILPADVTGSIFFLLSSSSCYINGQDIIVDDGFSL